MDQPGEQEEAESAGDNRNKDEERQIEMRHTAGDGRQFVGDRRDAENEDDRSAPSLIFGAKFNRGLLQAVEVDQPVTAPATEASVQTVAMSQIWWRRASIIGTSITSGGIGKKLLSAKDTAAMLRIAWRCWASRNVQS